MCSWRSCDTRWLIALTSGGALHGRPRWRIRREVATLPLGLPPCLRCRPSLLARLRPPRRRRFWSALGRTLLDGGASRRTRWRCAEPTDFASPQRLKLWRSARRPDGARRSDDVARGDMVAGCRLISAFTAQVCGADLDRAGQCRGAGKHARTNLIGRQRAAPDGCYVTGRNPWVHGETPIRSAHHYRAVDERGTTEKFCTSVERQQHRRDARRDQVPGCHEAPVRRVIIHIDVIRRLGCPSDVLIAVTPIDPGRAPYVTRNPEPAVVGVAVPPAVVIGDPAPIGLLIISDPIPAIVIRIDPVTDRVRTPIARPAGRHPHIAEPSVVMPGSVRFERDAEVGSDRRACNCLGMCWHHDQGGRSDEPPCNEAGQHCGSSQA